MQARIAKDKSVAGGRNSICILLCAWSWLLCAGPCAAAESLVQDEYLVKAAMVVNFMRFTDWPQLKLDANEPYLVGLVGKDMFGSRLDAMEDLTVMGRTLRVKRFGTWKEIAESEGSAQHELEDCSVLLVSLSEKRYLADILVALRQAPVLTVSDIDGFIDQGGMIGMVTEDRKIRFEINIVATKRAGLEMRSQMLRLAARVRR